MNSPNQNQYGLYNPLSGIGQSNPNSKPPSTISTTGIGPPTLSPNFIGQLYHDTSADTYYRSTGLTSADWVAISSGTTPSDCEMLSGAGDPTGVTTPEFVGQLYHDTGADTYYRSTGLTSADWTVISSGPTNITSGLVNYWSFDENSGLSAGDSIGGANGVFPGGAGNPTWIAGKINSGLSFNGSNWLDLFTNTSAGASAMTVSAWVYRTGSGCILYDSDDDTTSGFWFGLDNDNIWMNVVGSTGDVDYRGGSIPLSEWMHIAATWDGSIGVAGTHLYVNGYETLNLVKNANGSGTHLANSSSTRYIGDGGGGANGKLSGIIDDLRVYNRALTPTEIATLFWWSGP